MKKMCYILVCASLLLLLCACAPGETERAKVEGDRLIVTLESNPSTGYGWEYDTEGDPCFPSPAEYDYITEQHDLNLVGASGAETFTFAAKADGKTTLRFSYLRSFEENSTIRSYELSVAVSDGKIRILGQKYREFS